MLPTVTAAHDLAIPAEEAAAARAYAGAEKSAATIRAYKSDARAFDAWCQARGLVAFPATPDTVAAFLAHEADAGAKTSTIGRRAAAIGHAHKIAGAADPTCHETVKRVMRGIRRTIGTAPDQKAPATADVLAAMLSHVPTGSLRGKRDRALIALGFAAALRRSELVALNVEDLAFVAEGLRVTIRHSKTDQDGKGAEIAVPHGRNVRPVDAVRDWLQDAGITAGAVFRPITKADTVRADRLTAKSAADLVKHYAAKAGHNAADFGGHSLRAGFITSAADRDVDVLRIAEVSRHKSMEVLRGYVRRANAFKGHAGSGFL
jgi:site-specific recombinase XerD